MRRLMRELVQLKNEPPEGIRVSHPEDDMLDVTGIIEGPGECSYVFEPISSVTDHVRYWSTAGTPYEGGYFRVKFNFTEEFPEAPPKCLYLSFKPTFHTSPPTADFICFDLLLFP